ncbi:MAG: SGNH/GDSL hydrolase family protein [Alphaproteobacteria bacterium]|nr:SGNH/GDSL hydrolase family protein [Alphaproteobacteria bacterium]
MRWQEQQHSDSFFVIGDSLGMYYVEANHLNRKRQKIAISGKSIHQILDQAEDPRLGNPNLKNKRAVIFLGTNKDCDVPGLSEDDYKKKIAKEVNELLTKLHDKGVAVQAVIGPSPSRNVGDKTGRDAAIRQAVMNWRPDQGQSPARPPYYLSLIPREGEKPISLMPDGIHPMLSEQQRISHVLGEKLPEYWRGQQQGTGRIVTKAGSDGNQHHYFVGGDNKEELLQGNESRHRLAFDEGGPAQPCHAQGRRSFNKSGLTNLLKIQEDIDKGRADRREVKELQRLLRKEGHRLQGGHHGVDGIAGKSTRRELRDEIMRERRAETHQARPGF